MSLTIRPKDECRWDLNQVGKQPAIAVENALQFREIDALKNQLKEERRWEIIYTGRLEP